MTEEEVIQLKQELIDLKEAFTHLKEAAGQKDRRIEELEGLLMRALLRNDELERRLGKDSHNSHKPPSSDGLKHRLKPKPMKTKSSGGQRGHPGHALQ
jgi:transposase